MLAKTLAVLAALTLPTAAFAQSCSAPDETLELTDFDVGRLGNLEASREKGLAAANLNDGSDEGKLVAALFAEDLVMPDPGTMAGDYQCRTIKLGGIMPRTVYSWFKCRITEAGPGFSIQKLTGSQNFAGDLITRDDGYLLRGASHYSDEAPGAYGLNAERDEVGCLRQVAGEPKHLLLELPEPLLESFHDVIELKPAS